MTVMKSMTGYGRSNFSSGREHVIVEIKSVNHRFFDVSMQLPDQCLEMEQAITTRMKKQIHRGKIHVLITVKASEHHEQTVSIDWALFDQYVKAAKNMIDRHEIIEKQLSLGEWLFRTNIISESSSTDRTSTFSANVFKSVDEAVLEMMSMRSDEGKHLQTDIEKRLQSVRRYTEAISALQHEATEQFREKLTTRMKEMGVGIDDDRLMTEVAIMAEKSDISEELTRLASHAEQFEQVIGEAGPMGRKLDFILQEMNREANTIGSKVKGTAIPSLVIDVKATLEKLKEQVQNIE
ncbi:YicC/YloC family endoribonuclease [Geomicrobium sp. JCM 19039]|uniref:YicC/YloC family endoribonuclease n=1 Tax=Geomicrobium sp. JCM 19039 TaxID=1460636 RepID=UPI0005A6C84A|nr:YicC/YloC family endoribonuclease [Geomicrobium sp. JCM 19039]